MSSPVLHGHPVSQPARSVQWFLEHTKNPKGVRVEVKNFLATPKETRHPDFLAKFPDGQVPAYEEGDFLLSESCAILQYLAEGTPYEPKGAKDRARLNEYVGKHLSQVRKLTLDFLRPIAFGKVEDRGANKAKGLEKITPILQRWDAVLGKADYVLGSSLTLADFLFAPEVDQLQAFGADVLEPYANLREYLKRLAGVEGYPTCWEGSRAGLASFGFTG
eukprot:Sspe_Gene.38808::Locus_18716_Transcript_1_1_Confidence_1.000_Length_1094::g.38808::m.38808/K00799/GST, gst; glutathione S-transferase